jgi:hypothetical protein
MSNVAWMYQANLIVKAARKKWGIIPKLSKSQNIVVTRV